MINFRQHQTVQAARAVVVDLGAVAMTAVAREAVVAVKMRRRRGRRREEERKKRKRRRKERRLRKKRIKNK